MKKILVILFVLFLTACTQEPVDRDVTLTDAEKVALSRDSLTLTDDLANVKDDLTLPTTGEYNTTITWDSSNSAVLSSTGEVVRPVYGDGDATIQLKANITLNDEIVVKKFTVVVIETPDTEVPVITFTTAVLEVDTDVTDYDWGQYVTITDDYDTDIIPTFDLTNVVVDTLGTFTVDVTAVDDSGNQTMETLTVNVVDTTAPTATVVDSVQFFVGRTETIDWDSYITDVADSYDTAPTYTVDITNVDIDTVGNYVVTYTVTDGEGNETTVDLDVSVIENEPVINGLQSYYLVIDATEPSWLEGVTAFDAFGDLTSNIVVDTSSVVLSAEGEYAVTYTVTNDANQTTVETITVMVASIETYEIDNGGFETGDFTEWTTEGNAFKYITDQTQEYYGLISEPDGTYYFNTWKQGDHYNDHGTYGEAATGSLQSSIFTLGGTGYITFKLGAAKHSIYISIHKEDGTEIAKYRNSEYFESDDSHEATMWHTYVADLSEYRGESLYIKVIDDATGDMGIVLLDSFVSYYADETDIPEDTTEAINMVYTEDATNYEILNAGFEKGDLSGWTIEGNAFNNNGVYYDETYWGGSFGKDDDFFFRGDPNEGDTGTLTSSTFELGGTGWISFMIGGGKPDRDTSTDGDIYVSIHNVTDDTEIARFKNTEFSDNGYLNQYKADLSGYIGEDLYIKIVDTATTNWGWTTMDSFYTYYDDTTSLPEGATLATNQLTE